MTESRPSSFRGLALLWLAGNGLRLPILAMPPVLALIILDLKLTGTQVGVLNAIPVFLFGLVAIPGSLLIARVGAVPALIIGLLIAAAGSALRGLAFDAWSLYAATVVTAAGIAVMQPSLPPTVRQWVPKRIGFATAVYTNGLLCGEIFPVILAGLILALVGGWRASLALWSIPLICIALIIFVFQPGGSGAPVSRPKHWMPDWRDPLLWKLGLIMSGANQLYFCTNAFVPGVLLHSNQTEWIGPALSALNIGQLPASFVLLAMSSRWERKRWPFLCAGALGLLGLAGIVFTTSAWAVVGGATLIGFACAIVLTLVLALPALMIHADDVPRISAGMFTIGYGVAMVVSILGGMAWDATQDPAFAFLPVLIATLIMIGVTMLTDLSRRVS